MSDTVVTDHAEERVRKRLGLNRKAVDRQAQAALEKGARPSQFSGSFRRYLDGVALKERKANNLRVHAGSLYLFADAVLITCWPVPPKYRKVKPR